MNNLRKKVDYLNFQDLITNITKPIFKVSFNNIEACNVVINYISVLFNKLLNIQCYWLLLA